MEELLTVNEVSKYLKINYRKVLDMIALGELVAYKIGGVYRVSTYAIHKYLEGVKTK